jgi:transcriptional regulator with XRE-family HTH domain
MPTISSEVAASPAYEARLQRWESRGEFGRFLIIKRNQMKLSQVQLAARIGVGQPLVAKWERGNGLPNHYRYITPLAQALRVPEAKIEALIRMKKPPRRR